MKNYKKITRNALTELAERISKIRLPPTFYVSMEDYHTACNDLVKASQIITELAKVEWHNNPNSPVGELPDADFLRQAMVSCRVIAEEKV